MIQKELISRSPLRILENSIHGGIGKGNIGVIAARKGVGKTACLVHIATDRLFQQKHVIHVSFCANPDHIVAWYEDIFNEIARRNSLDGAMDVHDEIVRNRVIMNFSQDDPHIDKINKNIGLLKASGNFNVEAIVVDGFNFSKATPGDFREFKRLAADNDLEIWVSASLREENAALDERGVPALLAPFIDDISVMINLEPKGEFVHLTLIKDHDAFLSSDLHLKLDPQILLIAEEN